MASVFDDHKCAAFDFLAALGENLQKVSSNRGRRFIAKPKNNDTRKTLHAGSQQVSKIQIKRQDDTLFDRCLPQNVSIHELIQPFVPEMDRVVSFHPKGPDRAQRNPHIGQESHEEELAAG
jgi:hypothetical protein